MNGVQPQVEEPRGVLVRLVLHEHQVGQVVERTTLLVDSELRVQDVESLATRHEPSFRAQLAALEGERARQLTFGDLEDRGAERRVERLVALRVAEVVEGHFGELDLLDPRVNGGATLRRRHDLVVDFVLPGVEVRGLGKRRKLEVLLLDSLQGVLQVVLLHLLDLLLRAMGVVVRVG